MENQIKSLLKKRNGGCQCQSCQDTTGSILKMVAGIRTSKVLKLKKVLSNLENEMPGNRRIYRPGILY